MSCASGRDDDWTRARDSIKAQNEKDRAARE